MGIKINKKLVVPALTLALCLGGIDSISDQNNKDSFLNITSTVSAKQEQVKKTKWSNGKLKTYSKKTYYKNGKVKTYIYKKYNRSGKYTYNRTIKYASNGKTTSYVRYDKYGKNSSKWNWRRYVKWTAKTNGAKKKKWEKTRYANFKTKTSKTYTYNSKGKLKTTAKLDYRNYFSNGNISRKRLYKYNTGKAKKYYEKNYKKRKKIYLVSKDIKTAKNNASIFQYGIVYEGKTMPKYKNGKYYINGKWWNEELIDISAIRSQVIKNNGGTINKVFNF